MRAEQPGGLWGTFVSDPETKQARSDESSGELAMTRDLEQILERVRTLPPEDLRRLRAVVEQQLACTENGTTGSRVDRELEFRRRLVAAGLLRHATAPVRDVKRFRDWKPIAVLGEPISRTIIEERR